MKGRRGIRRKRDNGRGKYLKGREDEGCVEGDRERLKKEGESHDEKGKRQREEKFDEKGVVKRWKANFYLASGLTVCLSVPHLFANLCMP